MNVALVHNESSNILDKLVNKHSNLESNIILDQIMFNGEKSEKIIKKFKNNGYKVHILASFVEPAEAVKRASIGFEEEERYVPCEFGGNIGDKVVNNAHKLKDKVDSYIFVDNNGDFKKEGKPFKVSSS